MSSGKKRYKMRLALTEQCVMPRWCVRTISRKDDRVLGPLLFEAYAGTIDQEEETPEDALREIQGTLTGKYGPLLEQCSFMVVEQGHALCAAIVTRWGKIRHPLLAFLMTHPEMKNQGMGTYVLMQSVNALLEQGEKYLYLFVTEGNLPAQRVYEKLGFQTLEEYNV